MGATPAWDFSGYATKNNVRCSDGRTIRKDAFKEQDGKMVPIVWQHCHDDPTNVIGHGLLENREDGVYFYGSFNENQKALAAKEGVRHGDLTSMSIYANNLTQGSKGDVYHGIIREVSLVLAGANPEAMIDHPILMHSDDSDDDATMYFGLPINSLEHSDMSEEVSEKSDDENEEEELEHMAKEVNKEETVQDVIDTMDEKQKNVLAYLVSEALEQSDKEDGGNEMSHNVFDKEKDDVALMHDALNNIVAEARENSSSSLRRTFLSHAEDYGIDHVDYLFSDAKPTSNVPDAIKREDDWVSKFLNNVHRTPFSRVKSIHADITADEARAKGYVTGNLKLEEVITLLKRVTTATTIYKKQKMDRDDMVEITDFDVVAFLKTEMRGLLDEEIARAALVSDGRSTASEEKINELNIRPIWTDSDLYTIKQVFTVPSNATDDQKAKAFIRNCIKSRKNYRGSGNPILFTTEDVVTDCLLLEDNVGRVIYDTMEKLRTALRVRDIVTVPVMEGQTREVSGVTRNLMGIIVNPADYNIGADKGGAINMFEDFDIDYNQQKYLMETRCSGALIKPHSAIAVEMVVGS